MKWSILHTPLTKDRSFLFEHTRQSDFNRDETETGTDAAAGAVVSAAAPVFTILLTMV